MRAPHFIFFLIFLSCTATEVLAGNRISVTENSTTATTVSPDPSNRRILHQPLFPESSAPPPDAVTSSPPPPPPPPPPADSSALPTPEQPFFHELPNGPTTDQSQPPPPPQANGNALIPTATQPNKPTKTVAIAISVGIVTLGMLSGLMFFLYRHRVKHRSETQKLVGGGGGGGGDSQRLPPEDSRAPPSSFLYIGTVEPSRTSFSEPNGTAANREPPNLSPYRKLDSIKRSDRYRPSPELQPLPPLAKPPPPPPSANSQSAMSSEDDEESHETSFHSPQGSSIGYEETYYTPISRHSNHSNGHGHVSAINNCSPIPARNEIAHSIPHSKRTSPKSRFSATTAR